MTTTDIQSPHRIEVSQKRVRVYLGGELVADSTRPRLVWEVPHYPQYYFPIDDVRREALLETGQVKSSPTLGDGRKYTVKAGGKEAPGAAWRYDHSPVAAVRDLVRFHWDSMDAWFEEDEEVFVHPRDPYKRVDVLSSSRQVRVELDGVTLAESSRPRLLFETSLPVRYYLPKPDVRLDLLEESETVTRCPYKGTTVHYSARIGGELRPDVAWCYAAPVAESLKIAGLVAFYNERVDLYVDGERLERPKTPFS
jgi:uncharacterized protein (DUF427 family)